MSITTIVNYRRICFWYAFVQRTVVVVIVWQLDLLDVR